MKKSSYTKDGRITGAILSTMVFGVIFLILIFLVAFIQITEKMPTIFFIYIMACLILPTIGIFVSLFLRIKEIKRGEEDEAKKY